MNLRESFANKGLILNDLKRYWWTIIFQLLIFTICVPFMIIQEAKWASPGEKIHTVEEFMWIAAIGIGVLLSMLLFRYMHSKKSNILIHSLPIKKEAIYNSHILSGIIIMAIPIVINLILSIGTIMILRVSDSMPIMYLVAIHFITFLIGLAMFMIASAVTSFTGLTIAHGIFTGIISTLAYALGGLINMNLNYWLYGYSQHYHMNTSTFEFFTPLFRVMTLGNSVSLNYTDVAVDSLGKLRVNFEVLPTVCCLVMIVLFYIIGLIAYKKRKTEKCEILITFKWLEPIFKYGFVFCVMLSSIALVMYESVGYVIFAYIVSSVIAYVVAEVFIKKSIDAIKNIKGYIPYALIMTAIFVVVNFDLIGYENRVPKLSDIKEVIISSSYGESYDYVKRFTYTTPENIENIRSIHEAIVEDKERFKFNGEFAPRESVYIKYTLNNGKSIKRMYEVPSDIFYNNYSGYYDSIYSTDEYKKKEYGIFEINERDIDNISIYSNLDNSKRVVLIDKNELYDILSILRDEVLSMTPEEIRDGAEFGYIEVELNQEYIDTFYKENNIDKYSKESTISIPWKKSYSKLNKYLVENGLMDNLTVSHEEVKKIFVEDYDYQTGQRNTLEILDNAQINICLDNYEERWKYEGAYEYYEVTVELKNGETAYGGIRKEGAPKFIEDYFMK